MIISLIAAIGRTGELGFNNKLIWRISGDLAQFKQLTTGHHIVMGRKTFESIGRALPGRTNYVLTSSTSEMPPGIHTATNLQTVIDAARLAGETELFIIGGAAVYEAALPYVTRMYITHIDATASADAYFKPDWSMWTLKDQIHHIALLATPAWTFAIYERR